MLYIALFLMIFGIMLIIFSFWAERKAEFYSQELKGFISAAAEYEAAVLDVTEEKGKKAAIIQIRIESQKRTLVHRCTEAFKGSYKRGDRISVYLIEEMPADRSLIKGDNRFERFIRLEARFRFAERLCGGVFIPAGIILCFIR